MEEYTEPRDLLEIDSPVGYAAKASAYVFDLLQTLDLRPTLTNKGVVKCPFGPKPMLGLVARVDTLGLIVTSIKADGTLAFSSLGSPSLSSSEGEYVRIITQGGTEYTGTLIRR